MHNRIMELAHIFLDIIACAEKKRIYINTFPDYDDACRAVIEEALKSGYKIFVGENNKKKEKKPEWAEYIESGKKYSLKSLLAYHKSRYVFYTHGGMTNDLMSKKRLIINLWHGMPIKKIGILDGKKKESMPKFNFTIADNTYFANVMAKSFGVSLESVLINKNPRVDILTKKSSNTSYDFESNYLAVWMPTYRKSVNGDVRQDGDVNEDVFSESFDLSVLNTLFAEKKIICFMKPHPMSGVNIDKLKKYTNIRYISDDSLKNTYNSSTYELLSAASFLITDVSSVYVDFKGVGKKVIVYCPDIEEYNNNIGFSVDINYIIEEKICKNISDLKNEVLKINLEKSKFSVITNINETRKLFDSIGIT